VKYGSKNHVDVGVGILMALKEGIEQGDLPIVDNSNIPTVNASGGAGGHGGSGPSGGRGGDGGAGGSAHLIQVGKEFAQEGITIRDFKNPHKQYWGMFIKSVWDWIRSHISEVIIGLIITTLATWFGFNR